MKASRWDRVCGVNYAGEADQVLKEEAGQQMVRGFNWWVLPRALYN